MGNMSLGSGAVPSFTIQHRSRTRRSIDGTFTVRLWCLGLQRRVGRFENVKVSRRRVMNAKHLGIQVDRLGSSMVSRQRIRPTL